jgi:hypothetical protein
VRFEDALAAGALAPPPAGATPSPIAAPAGATPSPIAMPAGAAAPAAFGPPPAVVPPAAPAPATPLVRGIFGKPLTWTRPWAIVFVIWAVAAVGLAAVRVGMGPGPVLSPREQAAVQEVRAGQLQPGVTNTRALQLLTKQTAKAGQHPVWSVQDRRWDQDMLVSWELGGATPLSWTVSYGGKVTAGGQTHTTLTNALHPSTSPASALPMGLPSLPSGF